MRGTAIRTCRDETGIGGNQVKRKSLADEKCPMARILDIIGDWWTLLIVRDALAGVSRFNDFQRSLGAAKSSLSTRLKVLVDQGIFDIQPASDGSAYQEYVLTDKGLALAPVLTSLAQWGLAHAFKPGEQASQLVDKKTNRPLKDIELRSSDGRRLRASDIRFLSGLTEIPA